MSTNEELKKNDKKKKCLGLKSRWLEEKKVEENKSCLRVIHCERGIERKIVSKKKKFSVKGHTTCSHKVKDIMAWTTERGRKRKCSTIFLN